MGVRLRKWTRRAFIGAGTIAGGGLVLGAGAMAFAPSRHSLVDDTTTDMAQLTTWIAVSPDNHITVMVPHCEMGQGIHTALAMMAAEEMDADWSLVQIKEAPALDEYANGYVARAIAGDSVPRMLERGFDYGTYRLSPRWLPREFAFLKANVASACERKDPEVLGELLDSLKAFGLRASHPLIVRGTRFLLAEQNADGSWGDPAEENIRTRCHTTWTVIDGLRTYAWRGERLSLPEVKSMLRRWLR